MVLRNALAEERGEPVAGVAYPPITRGILTQTVKESLALLDEDTAPRILVEILGYVRELAARMASTARPSGLDPVLDELDGAIALATKFRDEIDPHAGEPVYLDDGEEDLG